MNGAGATVVSQRNATDRSEGEDGQTQKATKV